MNTSEQLDDLLLKWEDCRKNGSPLSADEICAECPEFRDELLSKIRALEAMERPLLGHNSTDTNPNRNIVNTDNPPPPQTTMHLHPGVVINGYKLEKPLGRGGVGEVWKATGRSGRLVAIKFVQLNTKMGDAELRALEKIKSLSHINLLSIIDTWENASQLVIVMELAERSLHQRLLQCQEQQLHGIPIDELKQYMTGVAAAIDYLNSHSIQHRDIKPHNLLLFNGGVKVADYGLLRELKDNLASHSGSMTPHYAPPEFYDHKTLDKSDQYSLAVTYCELRGGRLPFAGSPSQVMKAKECGSPDLNMLSVNERPVVEKALSKFPADRWQNCKIFVEELRKASEFGGNIIRTAIALPIKPSTPPNGDVSAKGKFTNNKSKWKHFRLVAFWIAAGVCIFTGYDYLSKRSGNTDPRSPLPLKNIDSMVNPSVRTPRRFTEAERVALIENNAEVIFRVAHPQFVYERSLFISNRIEEKSQSLTFIFHYRLPFQNIPEIPFGLKSPVPLPTTSNCNLTFQFDHSGNFVKCETINSDLIPPFKVSDLALKFIAGKLAATAPELRESLDGKSAKEVLEMYLRYKQSVAE